MTGKRRGPDRWTFGLGHRIAKLPNPHGWWRTAAEYHRMFPDYHRCHVLRVLAGLHRDGLLERRGTLCHYEYRKAQP